MSAIESEYIDSLNNLPNLLNQAGIPDKTLLELVELDDKELAELVMDAPITVAAELVGMVNVSKSTRDDILGNSETGEWM